MQKEDFFMTDLILNRYVLNQYGLLRSQVIELDKKISEVEDALAELNGYNVNISPVYTGMPSGNEKRDKIADFIIRLEDDRSQLNTALAKLTAERDFIKYSMYKIRMAVNQIPNKQLQDIIKWHYFDGQSVRKIANKTHMTHDGVYKKMNRYFKLLKAAN